MRAARLLSENKTGRLCAVSFTREGSAELKTRILDLCGEREAKRLAVGTFHSVGRSQLVKLKQFSKIKLLSEGERKGVLRRCYGQYKCDVPFEKVLSEIDRAKSQLGHVLFSDPVVEDVFNAYQALLATEGGMDFSDIMLEVVTGIRNGTIKPLGVRWLLADEFQDADEAQKSWIVEHGKAGVEITIVGDDDQSLYSFRNALGVEGMRDVTQTLVAQEITLPINYRCAPNILSHAAKLIVHNQNRANKSIQAARQTHGVIKTHRAADRYDEAGLIVKSIKENSKQSWAVIARTNSLLEIVESELIINAIPYRLAGGKSVWEGIAGSAFVGLLKSVQTGGWTGMANALAVCGVKPEYLNLPHDHKSCDQMFAKILEHCPENDTRTKKTIGSAQRGFAEWQKQLSEDNTSLVIFAVSNWLAQNIKLDRGDLIRRLAAILAKLRGSIAQRLNTLTRLGDNENTSGVLLSTIHSSKGLEFDAVWILGAEDNNLPHPDSTEEEERRLFYVGMTRARDRLEISSSLDDGLATRFLAEAGL